MIVLFTRAYFLLNKEDRSVDPAHSLSAVLQITLKERGWFIVHC